MNERHFRAFENFLEMIGAELDDFDTVISQEWVRGGKQYRFRYDSPMHDNLMKKASEVLLDQMP